ncbi:MAG: hypothetical protein R6V32_00340 [Bacteroidales bacterium]
MAERRAEETEAGFDDRRCSEHSQTENRLEATGSVIGGSVSGGR